LTIFDKNSLFYRFLPLDFVFIEILSRQIYSQAWRWSYCPEKEKIYTKEKMDVGKADTSSHALIQRRDMDMSTAKHIGKQGRN
jgi:hypothetical protein